MRLAALPIPFAVLDTGGMWGCTISRRCRTGPTDVRRAFDHLTGGKVEWNAMPEVYDRFFIAGQRFEFAAGLERFRDGLEAVVSGRGGGNRPVHRGGIPRATASADFIMRRRRCLGRLRRWPAA